MYKVKILYNPTHYLEDIEAEIFAHCDQIGITEVSIDVKSILDKERADMRLSVTNWMAKDNSEELPIVEGDLFLVFEHFSDARFFMDRYPGIIAGE